MMMMMPLMLLMKKRLIQQANNKPKKRNKKIYKKKKFYIVKSAANSTSANELPNVLASVVGAGVGAKHMTPEVQLHDCTPAAPHTERHTSGVIEQVAGSGVAGVALWHM